MAVPTIDPQTLRQWQAEGSAILVDVREPAEHRASRIPTARLAPLSRLRCADLPASGRLVLHCQKGGRGNSACEKLLKENPKLEVYNLAGGIEAWIGAGLPVEHGKRALPLDRQVQLTIGLLLLATPVLATSVNPAFVWLAGALGLGLTIAGFTGFCGLAQVMGRMPWNR
jgi:rhodanese-related sulfurtransferase